MLFDGETFEKKDKFATKPADSSLPNAKSYIVRGLAWSADNTLCVPVLLPNAHSSDVDFAAPSSALTSAWDAHRPAARHHRLAVERSDHGTVAALEPVLEYSQLL